MAGEMSEMDFMKQQQDQQIHNDPNSLYADTMREEKTSNILQQINPDNLLTDIEHRIRGEKKNVFSGDWEVISKEAPPISPLLVSNFISFLGSILNQNTSMSNFSMSEINNLMEVVTDWVKSDFVVHAKEYGIEGQYTEYDRIGFIILNNCFAVFKRALNGQESKRIFGMMKMTESNNQKKGGAKENFKFW